MDGDILRAAHQMQAQQAALAGLRAHYAGLAMAELLRWQLSRPSPPPGRDQEIDALAAATAVAIADRLIAALGRPRPPADHPSPDRPMCGF